MSTVLTADDLVNIKNTVLTLERQEIARNIDPSRFFGHLRAKYVFDERDCDEIRAVSSRVGSAEVFVDTLKRKGGKGYDEFCIALMNDKTQLFLLQRLTQTLELLRVKVIERKTERSLSNEQQQIPSSYHHGPHNDTPLHYPPPPNNAYHTQQQQPAVFQHNQYPSPPPFGPSSYPSALQKGYHAPSAFNPPPTAGRNFLPGNGLPGQLPVVSEGNPHNVHSFPSGMPKPTLRKVQSRHQPNRQQSCPGSFVVNMPHPSPPTGLPQGQDVHTPLPHPPLVGQQSNHHFLSPMSLVNNTPGMVPRAYPAYYHTGDVPQDIPANYPSNNPPVLPGMYSRGMSEGCEYPVEDLRIGCGHRLEPPDMDYPCGQVVLARGSD